MSPKWNCKVFQFNARAREALPFEWRRLQHDIHVYVWFWSEAAKCEPKIKARRCGSGSSSNSSCANHTLRPKAGFSMGRRVDKRVIASNAKPNDVVSMCFCAVMDPVLLYRIARFRCTTTPSTSCRGFTRCFTIIHKLAPNYKLTRCHFSANWIKSNIKPQVISSGCEASLLYAPLPWLRHPSPRYSRNNALRDIIRHFHEGSMLFRYSFWARLNASRPRCVSGAFEALFGIEVRGWGRPLISDTGNNGSWTRYRGLGSNE